ncbi:hypothetical protein CMI37_32590 [Candidatus Pacearchaeota archaeon]|nr:hypothetical protein [Candidatus Pacearchaeota archaeon]
MASETNPFEGYLSGGSDWSSLLLEALPQAAYYSSPKGQTFGAGSPRKQRYYQQGYSDTFNQYMGALGQQIRAGTDPNLTFQSFLESDPWTSRYAQLPQGMRGVNTGMYNPRTRFLYY